VSYFALIKQSPVYNDDQDTIWFPAYAGRLGLTCSVSKEALLDRERADSLTPDECIKVAERCFDKIQAAAVRKYELGQYDQYERHILICSVDLNG
jgi:hypothetical protein